MQSMEDYGEIVLIEPTPGRYTELNRTKVVDGKCWSIPAVSNGRLYVRSTAEGACLDVSP